MGKIVKAEPDDLQEILDLQYLAYDKKDASVFECVDRLMAHYF